MKRGFTVVYSVDTGLYINMTNRCSNSCSFCIRNNGDGAYGSDSLWLVREPSVMEILEALDLSHPENYKEIVFCGYGEPTYRLFDMLEVAKAIKKKYPDIPIRVNTNGQSDLINCRDTAEYFAVFDTVSVSLNAPGAKRYNDICHSAFGEKALDSVINFAKNVKNYCHNVHFSVVKGFITEAELAECYIISKACGVPLRVRDYIAPESDE